MIQLELDFGEPPCPTKTSQIETTKTSTVISSPMEDVPNSQKDNVLDVRGTKKTARLLVKAKP